MMISPGIDIEDRPSINWIRPHYMKTQVWSLILIFIVCLDQFGLGPGLTVSFIQKQYVLEKTSDEKTFLTCLS